MTTGTQLSLDLSCTPATFQPPTWYTDAWPWGDDPAGPPLTWWDAVIIASSGGKDSQAMTLWLSEQSGFDPSRTWVIHNDTGQEHRGALEKAQEAATHAGIAAGRVLVTRPYLGRTLLDLVLMRRRWPGMNPRARPCTRSLKVSPTDKLLRLMGDHARLLLLTGERREESFNRAKMPYWSFRRATSQARQPKKRRLAVHWRPLLDWRTDQVFDGIARHGQKPLWVYDAGLVRSQIAGSHDGDALAYSRASCTFCIYLRPQELELSFNLYPALACLATRVEAYIDHRWRQDLALADVWAKVYGPNGYRAVEGKRLLSLGPEALVAEATGQRVDEIATELVDSLLAAAKTKIV
jgi:3'-phosphoadenosine 5'-phosphosulfate sulfotransferase (PAPS reductase)/FAD synthetase